MSLTCMHPTYTWDEDAHEETVETLADLADDDVTVMVFGGDWCKDCRAVLPDFAAALEAAGFEDEQVDHYLVEKADDGSKEGPKVEEYGVDLIPTIVVKRDGEEVARFVEEENLPPAVWLAQELRGDA